ncbi:acetyl-CoA carboxylase biotin carboxylase subunit [Rhizobium skierniewicense]|uniref:acetyl-CoA carboxylase biotin carboxylase subunit n=1 Tax=Rhizobium skierniewicense TaxID=984260 RepID=UPI001FAD5F9D|nr:acetyl-CoA carboxylase biotin carboxylase subunit [Rhizobium skierniewicense]MCI9867321.1 acetyl-CoA carboxylase biotin carboxylase subunit [Rhizobium skierniewicense]
MTIQRILIANRGEIAVRIIQTCRKLGIETVLAVSEADRDSLGARLATRTVCIGPAPSSLSYLKVEAIVGAATGTGCDAVHPGYGFLSENARLAEACADNGIIFIGPTADQILAVGDKLKARAHAQAAGVPVVPGGPVETLEEAKVMAVATGYPLLIKAVAGGGGRGMKRVNTPDELSAMVDMAMAEASAAFGDGRVYLERYVAAGRHVEVQVLGDGENVIHLGERDCSVQRRYQKVIEEAPAPDLSDEFRNSIHEAALKFSRHLGYKSLGTVEFLVDCEREEFYFLEMNARIQVEHPVTEAITGLDLVEEQIRVADGNALRFGQEDITFDGYAIECRLNAESIDRDFQPSPGRITEVWFPAGLDIRVDTFVQAGSFVVPYYDSMIAKVIAKGRTRQEAIATLNDVMKSAVVNGVDTNRELHQVVLAHPAFAAGAIDTNFLTNLVNAGELAQALETMRRDC